MKVLVGQRLFNNNIFCTTWIIPHPRNNQEIKLKKINERKLNKRKLNIINFIQKY